VVAGVYLNRFQDGKFTNYSPRQGLPIQALRTVYCGRDGSIYVAGFGGVVRREGNRFVSVLRARWATSWFAPAGPGTAISGWVAASGADAQSQGELRHYTVEDGLPDNYVRSVWEDRDGNLWAGTDGGLARLENGRFVSSPLASSHEREWVRCIYEDTEGNLWVGMNSGLNRLRNDLFSMYGESEGLPSDEPTTVYQDHRGRIWVGFHDRGLVQLVDGKPARVYTQKDGLPSNEIFSIRENRDGDC
jgi:hypothetical protein